MHDASPLVLCRACLGLATPLVLCLAGCGSGFEGGFGGDSGEGANLRLRLAQSLEGNINRDLTPGEHDALLQSALNAGLKLDLATARALLSAELGVEARYILGEDQDVAGEGQINPQLSVNGSYRTRGTTFSGDGSVQFQSTETTQLEDTGLIDNDTQQITVVANLGLSHQLTPRNGLSVVLNANLVDFADTTGGLVPTRTLGGTLAWTRTLTRTTTLSTSLGLRHFMADNINDTRSQAVDLSIGLAHERTPRHSFNISGGITAVRTLEQGEPEFEISFTGDAGMSYRLNRLSTTLDLSQGVEPSSIGALQVFTRAIGTLNYTVNGTDSLGFSLNLSRRSDIASGEASQLALSFGPQYSLRLTRDVSMSLAYTFQLTNDDDTGTGHRALLSFNQDLDLGL